MRRAQRFRRGTQFQAFNRFWAHLFYQKECCIVEIVLSCDMERCAATDICHTQVAALQTPQFHNERP